MAQWKLPKPKSNEKMNKNSRTIGQFYSHTLTHGRPEGKARQNATKEHSIISDRQKKITLKKFRKYLV